MLRIANLSVAYGPAIALSGVSLQVNRGEVVCLLGSNSSGKTTLIRAVLGLQQQAAGQIYFKDEELRSDDVVGRVRRGIAWVPEGRGVLKSMSVLDNLLIGAYSERDKVMTDQRLQHAFDMFPVLAARRHQMAGTLSGGEQQMVAIGRALMARPELVLMDEPSMGLSPKIVEQLFEVIATINRAGVSVLLVEQNAHMALLVARRFYVLQKGQIVLAGDVVNQQMRVTVEGSSRQLDESELEHAYLGG